MPISKAGLIAGILAVATALTMSSALAQPILLPLSEPALFLTPTPTPTPSTRPTGTPQSRYKLTISIEPSNAPDWISTSVSTQPDSDGLYLEGTTVVLQAFNLPGPICGPIPLWRFSHWSSTVVQSRELAVQIRMEQDTDVVAVFQQTVLPECPTPAPIPTVAQTPTPASALPDLRIHSIGFTYQAWKCKSSPWSPRPLSLRVVVRNHGAGDAGVFTVQMNDKRSTVHEGLEAGEWVDVEFDVNVPGSYSAIVDVDDQVIESIERDNEAVPREVFPLTGTPIPACTPTAVAETTPTPSQTQPFTPSPPTITPVALTVTPVPPTIAPVTPVIGETEEQQSLDEPASAGACSRPVAHVSKATGVAHLVLMLLPVIGLVGYRRICVY